MLTRLGGMRNITMPIFFQNWSIQSRDIAIFRFSKWPPPPSFIFTSGSAMAEGPCNALFSRNSATTKYPYRMALFA